MKKHIYLFLTALVLTTQNTSPMNAVHFFVREVKKELNKPFNPSVALEKDLQILEKQGKELFEQNCYTEIVNIIRQISRECTVEKVKDPIVGLLELLSRNINKKTMEQQKVINQWNSKKIHETINQFFLGTLYKNEQKKRTALIKIYHAILRGNPIITLVDTKRILVKPKNLLAITGKIDAIHKQNPEELRESAFESYLQTNFWIKKKAKKQGEYKGYYYTSKSKK